MGAWPLSALLGPALTVPCTKRPSNSAVIARCVSGNRRETTCKVPSSSGMRGSSSGSL